MFVSLSVRKLLSRENSKVQILEMKKLIVAFFATIKLKFKTRKRIFDENLHYNNGRVSERPSLYFK